MNVKIHGLVEIEVCFWTLYLAVQPFCVRYDLTGLFTELLRRKWKGMNTTERFSNYTSKSILNYVDMMQLFTHICEICMNNFPFLLNPTFTLFLCVIYFSCCCCCDRCAFPQVFKGQSFIRIVI